MYESLRFDSIMVMFVSLLMLHFVCGAAASPPLVPHFPWFNTSLCVSDRATALVRAMTTDEKVSQLVNIAVAIPRLGIKSYDWRSNVLHGTTDTGHASVFPQAIGVAATWNATVAAAIAVATADEQRAINNRLLAAEPSTDGTDSHGLDVWGPNINLVRDPRWGRGQETFGECPVLTASLAVPVIRGLQEGPAWPKYYKLLATPKHFDAYSLDRTPPRLSFDPNISATDLAQTYLWHWQRVIPASSPGSVMCAYSGVNGFPSCMSPMLQEDLRVRFGFDGYIVTDSGAVEFMVSEYHRFHHLVDAAAASLNAGVDLNSGRGFRVLGSALAQGKVNASRIDEALRRTFSARIRMGMLDPVSDVPYRTISPSVIDSAAHRKLARDAAVQSFVLLQNRGSLLPLDPSRRQKVAVIGPHAKSPFSLMGDYSTCYVPGSKSIIDPNCTLVTIWDGLQAAGTASEFTYNQGCEVAVDDQSNFTAARQIAAAADVLILALGYQTCDGARKGTTNCVESEGRDRTYLGLPAIQEKLLTLLVSVGKPIVLLLFGGSGIALPYAVQHVGGILMVWYPGEEGGNAAADVVFGKRSPSGRLPVTVYSSLSQVPSDTVMDMAAPPGRTYRYLTEAPQWTFGFGLSYTTFAYSSFSLSQSKDAVTACVSVRNTGPMESTEVTQLYWSFEAENSGKSSYPLQQLGNSTITRIGVGNAAPICLSIVREDLHLVGPDGVMRLNSGMYRFYIGGQSPRFSRESLLNGTLHLV